MPARSLSIGDDSLPAESVRSVDAPIEPNESLYALDWLNGLVAALLTASGPFVALSLTDRGWAPANIGLVLTAGGLAGLLSQVPAGELIDMARSKRMLIGAAGAIVTLGIAIFALRADFPSVFAAVVIQGAAASVLGPAIVAISLGLVGQRELAHRLGRNQRFASIGGLTAGAVMGVVGYFSSTQVIFLVTAAFALPAIWALVRIRPQDIHFGRSRCAPENPAHPPKASRAVLFKDPRLVTFAVCLFLFQLANASVLPLVGETLTHAEGRWSSLVMSALIVVPQIIVALFAPKVGRTANIWGRRPLLLIGLGAVPIRATLLGLTADPALLALVQLLDGLSGATLGVLTAVVIADLAKGTGRFNLAQGLVGTLSALGASFSTSASGYIVGTFGHMAGFMCVTIVGLLSVAIFWMFMPETKPLDVQAGAGID